MASESQTNELLKKQAEKKAMKERLQREIAVEQAKPLYACFWCIKKRDIAKIKRKQYMISILDNIEQINLLFEPSF